MIRTFQPRQYLVDEFVMPAISLLLILMYKFDDLYKNAFQVKWFCSAYMKMIKTRLRICLGVSII